MRVVLHLGFHKTGTSSVQALLRANADRMPAGVAVLVQADPRLKPLEEACRAADAGRLDLVAVEAESQRLLGVLAAGPATWLVSSEDLLGRIPSSRDGTEVYGNAPAILAALARGLAGAELSGIVYTRDHAPWVDSLYRHLLRTRGVRMRGSDFAALPKFAPGCLDAAAERLAQGAPFPVALRRFEDDLSEPPGPGRAYLLAAGLSPDHLARLAPVPRQNPGIGAADVAFMERPLLMALPRRLRKAILDRRLGR